MIARMLHMTLEELEGMRLAEYHQWRAFRSHEETMRKLHG